MNPGLINFRLKRTGQLGSIGFSVAPARGKSLTVTQHHHVAAYRVSVTPERVGNGSVLTFDTSVCGFRFAGHAFSALVRWGGFLGFAPQVRVVEGLWPGEGMIVESRCPWRDRLSRRQTCIAVLGRTHPIESGRVICPLGIGEVGRSIGECVGAHRGPHRLSEIGGCLHHDRNVGCPRDSETESV